MRKSSETVVRDNLIAWVVKVESRIGMARAAARLETKFNVNRYKNGGIQSKPTKS